MVLDKTVMSVVGLRAAALVASLAGQTKLAQQLYQLADLVNAGLATDAHMKEVADKLATRNAADADFTDVLQRIESERGKLHSDNPPPIG
jgi:hypothetical protein